VLWAPRGTREPASGALREWLQPELPHQREDSRATGSGGRSDHPAPSSSQTWVQGAALKVHGTGGRTLFLEDLEQELDERKELQVVGEAISMLGRAEYKMPRTGIEAMSLLCMQMCPWGNTRHTSTQPQIE
ncbi:Zinc finger and SCAN domain-containing protein, partial [Schistosoma japonicum]